MRNVERLLSIALALLIAGCHAPPVKGSGKASTQTRNVRNFTAVTFHGSGRLVIEQSRTESLTITADDNLLPFLTSTVRNSRLILDTKSDTEIEPSSTTVYKLTVKQLNDIELSSIGNIDVKGIQTDDLKSTISGSGNLTLNGQADRQVITLSDAGNYRGEYLKSQDAAVDLSGSGNVTLAVNGRLDVKLSGEGSVEYIGNPAVAQQILGTGTVHKR